jgi:hypothetical protein
MELSEAVRAGKAMEQDLQNYHFKADDRSKIAAACFAVARQHYNAILCLLGSRPPLHAPAFALLRLLIEATFRGHWASHCANNEQLENLLTGSQRQLDAASMISAVGKVAEASGSTVEWKSFYKTHWGSLSAFAHTYEDQLRCWLTTDNVEPKYSPDAVSKLIKRAYLIAMFAAAGTKALAKSSKAPNLSNEIQTAEQHLSHLIDAFAPLREKYALLHQMLYKNHVPEQYGSHKRARGFLTLRTTLYLACCQDIAKLSADNYATTPSIKKLVDSLGKDSLRAHWQKSYCDNQWTYVEGEDPPFMAAVYEDRAIAEEARYKAKYDAVYAKLLDKWGNFWNSETLNDFRQIRDKVSAHTELIKKNGKFETLDTSALSVEWHHLESSIDTMQQIIGLLNWLIRNGDFQWQSLEYMVNKTSTDFWDDCSVGHNS